MLSDKQDQLFIITAPSGAGKTSLIKNILKAYPKAESVFISPPSIEDLRQRLLDRGLDSEDVINQRVSGAEKEILQKTNFKHEIINISLDTATKKLINIIFRENHG